MKKRIQIYDTTLRDGSQAETVSFSVLDKLKILQCLDEFGIDYMEGGWPSSNPKDTIFFEKARDLDLKHTRLSAFGSTRHHLNRVDQDPNLKALINCGTRVVTIFGKTWRLHVKDILGCTLDENLEMISESITFIKAAGLEVIFDAEHFYDGFLDNSKYAIEVLRVAREAGADCLVLCDTNGGMIPSQFRQITSRVVEEFKEGIGVHVHNDSGVAVANSLEAVEIGVDHIQGTFGGLGERCGNADLVSIIPNLIVKMDYELGISLEKLRELTHVARYISTIANSHFPENSPYVGARAFTHKGGVHVNSVMKQETSYEHIPPEIVGNDRRFLVSELAGRSNILQLAKHEGINLDKAGERGSDNDILRSVVQEIKQLENKGYQFEGAEASAALIIKQLLGEVPIAFELVGFRVIIEKRMLDKSPISEATVKIRVSGREKLSVGEGNGPVAALDAALRTAMKKFYPEVADIRLTDYRVRVIDEDSGSAAKVRVVIDSTDSVGTWSTVGVSENIIEASWLALVDSIIYGLIRHGVINRFTSKNSSQEKEF